MDKTITAIIPVKGNSTRLPNKNVLPFGNSNLLQHKIDQLKQVEGLHEIICSSDSDEMLQIAEKAGIPIVPMTIVNSAAIFEDHFPKIKKATVIIEYGTPIDIKQLSKEERKLIGNTVKSVIEETYFKNKELL